jgi:hypothetical protein
VNRMPFECNAGRSSGEGIMGEINRRLRISRGGEVSEDCSVHGQVRNGSQVESREGGFSLVGGAIRVSQISSAING